MRTFIIAALALGAASSLSACNNSGQDSQDALSNQDMASNGSLTVPNDERSSDAERDPRRMADDMHNQMDRDEHNRMMEGRDHRGRGMNQGDEPAPDAREDADM
jgi:hypothetical protein